MHSSGITQMTNYWLQVLSMFELLKFEAIEYLIKISVFLPSTNYLYSFTFSVFILFQPMLDTHEP